MTYDGVAAISFTSDLIDQIDNMLRSLDIVIVVLIVSAGLLAFVVLYNLNNINITERQRELATLKVLGFFDGEVASYVYRENMVLTLFGVIAGMGIGTFFTSLRNSDRRGRYDDVRTKRVPAELRLERPDYPGVCSVRQFYDVLPVKKN